MYDEFCSILLNQFKSRVYEKFETFDAALDEFYSKIESQRSEQQQKAKEDSASQKLNKIRQDQVCGIYQGTWVGLYIAVKFFYIFKLILIAMFVYPCCRRTVFKF